MTNSTEHTPAPTLKDVLPLLESEQIDEVIVEFSGGGDSGQIDDVRYYRENKNVTRDHFGEVMTKYVDGQWKQVRHEPTRPMPTVKGSYTKWGRRERQIRDFTVDEIIEDYVYRRISSTGVDWHNNDGGQGTYTLKHEGGVWQFQFLVDVNYVELRTAHESSGALSLELEEEA